jgi:ATP-dependent protease ClpP protease subunit
MHTKIRFKKGSKRPKKTIVANAVNKSPEARVNAESLHLDLCFDRGINLRDRIIQVTGDIERPLFDFVDAALNEMERQSKSTVTLKVHSLGGSVYEALAILGRIERSPCYIVTEGYGAIMSAATLLLACGDRRKLSRRAWFMHHEASYLIEGRHASNKAAVAQAEREERAWADTMAQLTNKPSQFWLKKGMHVDSYFTAEQLLELGVVDEIF